jgi:hypothetical protein
MDIWHHMSQACADYDAGFHFEEGGCAGMAIAIHEALAKSGENPVYVSFRNICHIAVLCDARLIDHSGASHVKAEFDEIPEARVLELAAEWGCNVPADLEWARAIVARAHELAQGPAP